MAPVHGLYLAVTWSLASHLKIPPEEKSKKKPIWRLLTYDLPPLPTITLLMRTSTTLLFGWSAIGRAGKNTLPNQTNVSSRNGILLTTYLRHYSCLGISCYNPNSSQRLNNSFR